MNEATPIPLPGLKRVWKVSIVDNIEKPTLKTVLMMRGETAQDVMTKAPRTVGFQAFKEKHQGASIAEVQFLGELDN
jgi:hypothetical protein